MRHVVLCLHGTFFNTIKQPLSTASLKTAALCRVCSVIRNREEVKRVLSYAYPLKHDTAALTL